MAVDSKLVGDWAASSYLPDGVRVDYGLSLQPDGSYVWWSRPEGRRREFSQGTWYHDYGLDVLYLTPYGPRPSSGTDNPQAWRVLPTAGWEQDSAVMVLRRVVKSGGNSPVLFYRVQARGD